MRRWGPVAFFRITAWQREMENAVFTLPTLKFVEAPDPVELWFLTGRNFWYQTAFCAWTFSRHAKRPVVLNLVDDGSLTKYNVDNLRRLFPAGLTIRPDIAQLKLDATLPSREFPVLRQRWADYINIRKLTDIHLSIPGRKLVLDSDMLFFARPSQILDWFDKETEVPLLMTDCEESYGYSRGLMTQLSGNTIPPLLNVGVCGLHSQTLNWSELEIWCRTLVDNEGTNYYLEQALVAMIASRTGADVLPTQDYITFPNLAQIRNRIGVLQHYVADSKPWYFKHAWRLALL